MGGSPTGKVPSTCTPWASIAKPHAATLPAATPTSTAGTRRVKCGQSVMRAAVPSPRASEGRWIASIWRAALSSVPTKPSVGAMLRRRSGPSWLEMIRMPAPAVKPTATESETKLTSTPKRASPISSRMSPAITAISPAAAI